jgi:small subunit ribosomal protein S6
MTFSEYETTVVLRADVGGDAIEATLDKVREAVRGRGGKLIAINHWGKKKLAYDIAKQTRGVYVHAQFLGFGKMVHEIERNLRISDSVLRFLTVRVADNVEAQERQEADYVRPSYEDAEEAEAESAEATAEQASAEAPAAAGERGNEAKEAKEADTNVEEQV